MHMANIVDGKAFAEKLKLRHRQETEALQNKHRVLPGLAVVLVGDNPASQSYVANKKKTAASIGFHSVDIAKPATISEDDLLRVVDELNRDSRIHGILVQLPLPKHIREDIILGAIDPGKDVDGFGDVNAGKLAKGKRDGFVPCTPLGCLMLLKEYIGDLTGKRAVVIGRSNIVGKPMAVLLESEHCTVTKIHSKTPASDIPAICRAADILIAAIGQPKFVRGDWIKPGAVVIDVGINRIMVDGTPKLVGDVDFDSACAIASAITPVPGGVGPMTIACLMDNTIRAACGIHGIDRAGLTA